jgi:hypothetical protein
MENNYLDLKEHEQNEIEEEQNEIEEEALNSMDDVSYLFCFRHLEKVHDVKIFQDEHNRYSNLLSLTINLQNILEGTDIDWIIKYFEKPQMYDFLNLICVTRSKQYYTCLLGMANNFIVRDEIRYHYKPQRALLMNVRKDNIIGLGNKVFSEYFWGLIMCYIDCRTIENQRIINYCDKSIQIFANLFVATNIALIDILKLDTIIIRYLLNMQSFMDKLVYYNEEKDMVLSSKQLSLFIKNMHGSHDDILFYGKKKYLGKIFKKLPDLGVAIILAYIDNKFEFYMLDLMFCPFLYIGCGNLGTCKQHLRKYKKCMDLDDACYDDVYFHAVTFITNIYTTLYTYFEYDYSLLHIPDSKIRCLIENKLAGRSIKSAR